MREAIAGILMQLQVKSCAVDPLFRCECLHPFHAFIPVSTNLVRVAFEILQGQEHEYEHGRHKMPRQKPLPQITFSWESCASNG